MIVYDYSNLNLFVVGDIHGEFNQLFNIIKTNIAIEHNDLTDNDLLDELRKVDKRKRKISLSNSNKFNNSVIVVLGDCGIGFNKEQYYFDIFGKYNELLSKSNTVLLFIRGNHDDPEYFNKEIINFSHIKSIPDYSILKTSNNVSLCIGGAISIDRIWRKQQEVLINKYKKNYKKKLYWENENCVYDEEKLNEIIDSGIHINSILSHTSPSFAYPQDKNNSIKWFKVDPNLRNDINHERDILNVIYDFLCNKNQNITFWCYGHFHDFNAEYKVINERKINLFALSDNYRIEQVSELIKMNSESEELSKIQQYKKLEDITWFTYFDNTTGFITNENERDDDDDDDIDEPPVDIRV